MKPRIAALLRRLLRVLETTETMTSAASSCATPEVRNEDVAHRLLGFLERKVDKLGPAQRQRFYKSLMLKLTKILKLKSKELLAYLKLVSVALQEQSGRDEEVEPTLRLDLVVWKLDYKRSWENPACKSFLFNQELGSTQLNSWPKRFRNSIL